MTSDVNDFLFGGGGKAAKFDEVGDMVDGEIVHSEISQQTDMENNTPLTWSDGSPRMQLVVTLQTGQRDSDDDDGLRRIYAKGGKFEAAEGKGRAMKDAIADAVRKAGEKTLADGGRLKVAYTGIAKKTNRGYNAAKLYTASYTAPKSDVGLDDFDF